MNSKLQTLTLNSKLLTLNFCLLRSCVLAARHDYDLSERMDGLDTGLTLDHDFPHDAAEEVARGIDLTSARQGFSRRLVRDVRHEGNGIIEAPAWDIPE